MAWQNFKQFDLYNQTLAHVKDYWTVTWDNGTWHTHACRFQLRCHNVSISKMPTILFPPHSTTAIRRSGHELCTCDAAPGTIPGYNDWACTHHPAKPCSLGYYNLSNPAMRKAWVGTQVLMIQPCHRRRPQFSASTELWQTVAASRRFHTRTHARTHAAG
eukprot:SAG11_NODE_2776_length_2983_cov_2.095354_2_plen_160_part_00